MKQKQCPLNYKLNIEVCINITVENVEKELEQGKSTQTVYSCGITQNQIEKKTKHITREREVCSETSEKTPENFLTAESKRKFQKTICHLHFEQRNMASMKRKLDEIKRIPGRLKRQKGNMKRERII